MTDFIGYIQEIIGVPPAGCESLEYMIAGALLLLLCMSAINLISSIFRWIGGL